jgi:hypothetical protein
MLTRKLAEALENQSSAEHGKVLCQEINNHYNTHVLCRDIVINYDGYVAAECKYI